MSALKQGLLSLVLIVALSAPGVVRADAPPRFPPDAEAAMQAALDGVTQNGDVPGIALLIDAPAGRFAGASGFSDLDAATPLQPDDAFRIGSVSKMFSAVVLLQLQEEGVLSLDDPLARWLPAAAAGLPNGDLITLRHLLNHTSGVTEYTGDAQTMLTYFHDPSQAYTPQQIMERVIEIQKADFAPGEQWAYSNTNYILAGMVIEAATGGSAAAALRARIFEPLRLAHTYLDGSEPPTGDLVHGYTTDLSGQRADASGWNVSFAYTAGAIVSTPSDLARFIRALFAGELFTDPDSLHKMLTTVDAGGTGYGLGIGTVPPEAFGIADLASDVWGHGGGIFGYASLLYYVPDLDLVLVTLVNSDHGDVMGGALVTALQAALPTLQAAAG